jgi:hypothetical protein
MRDRNIAGLRQAITNRVISFSNKISAFNNFFRVQGTLPSSPTSDNFGVRFTITSAGSPAFSETALFAQLNAGYTGAKTTASAQFLNSALGTGTGELAGGLFFANYGINAANNSVGSGVNVGGVFRGFGSTTRNYGSISAANEGNIASTVNIGNLSLSGFTGATTTIGLAAALGTAAPTYTSAALLADNSTSTLPVIIARENGTTLFTIDTGGDIKILRTITTAGTTGNQTINKPAGTVNFAAAATSLVVTNSLVTASSIIELSIRTQDVTMTSVSYAAAAGSFTINSNAPASAEVSVGFLVTN